MWIPHIQTELGGFSNTELLVIPSQAPDMKVIEKQL